MAAPSLPADVAAIYKMLRGHGVGEYHWSGSIINLQLITLDQAASLVDRGFPYLVAKKQRKGSV